MKFLGSGLKENEAEGKSLNPEWSSDLEFRFFLSFIPFIPYREVYSTLLIQTQPIATVFSRYLPFYFLYPSTRSPLFERNNSCLQTGEIEWNSKRINPLKAASNSGLDTSTPLFLDPSNELFTLHFFSIPFFTLYFIYPRPSALQKISTSFSTHREYQPL